MSETGGSFKLGLIQFTPQPLDVSGNLRHVRDELICLADDGAEVMLLPELWATGPIYSKKDVDGHEINDVLLQLNDFARRHGVYIVGTLPQSVDEDLYDSTYLAGPDQSGYVYRKIHLFAPMGEDRVFLPGREPAILWIPLKCGETGFGLLTCFDLRFPELARHLAWHGADVLLISALWPRARRSHFELLLKARAIENQCYVAAANACGCVGKIDFAGASAVIDPSGNTVVGTAQEKSKVIASIDLAQNRRVRKKFLTAHPPRSWWPSLEGKITTIEDLVRTSARRRRAGQQMVFTNGCFDILHAGHVSYLQSARQQGDFLVIGLNSDASVQRIKGPDRPANPQVLRAKALAGLASVDYIVVFDDPTPLELIRTLLPDVLVKGADWEEKDIAGADIVLGSGGRVHRVPFVHNVSTTTLIKHLSKKN